MSSPNPNDPLMADIVRILPPPLVPSKRGTHTHYLSTFSNICSLLQNEVYVHNRELFLQTARQWTQVRSFSALLCSADQTLGPKRSMWREMLRILSQCQLTLFSLFACLTVGSQPNAKLQQHAVDRSNATLLLNKNRKVCVYVVFL